MSSNKSKSAAPAERERLLPPALVLTFTAMVGVGLALMFPRETLRERLLGQGRTVDGLTVAYLEAWSRVAPTTPVSWVCWRSSTPAAAGSMTPRPCSPACRRCRART